MHEHHKHTPLLQAIQSSNDPELKQLKSFVLNGWPRYVKPAMQPYNRDRLTYCVHNGAVYKDYRLVVPSSFRSQILNQLHEGHIGIGRMRSKAREIYWWPGIDRDIANFVSRCVLCRKARNIPRNADLQNWSETTYPMERVHADVCHLQGKLYMVIIDSFSKFVNVVRISTVSASQFISAFESTFKFTGLPTAVVTDNATGFISEEFRRFLSKRDILFINSPPFHSQSNGLAERTIQSFKRFVAKNPDDEFPEHHFCYYHNFTPLASTLYSPSSEILQYRARTHTDSPVPILVNHDASGWREAILVSKESNTARVNIHDRMLTAHSSRLQQLPSSTPSVPVAARDTPAASPVPVPASAKDPTPVSPKPQPRRSLRTSRPPDRLTYERKGCCVTGPPAPVAPRSDARTPP